jgi:PASTA domain
VRRRFLVLGTLVGLALALVIGIEAALAEPGLATLTVSVTGTGSGRVVSQPEVITCPGICSGHFPVGTTVALHVNTAAGVVTAKVDGPCGRPWPDKPFRGCLVTLKGDTSIRFTFNGSMVPCDVPSLRGKTLAKARLKLTENACTVGTVTHSLSRRVKKGRVISQSPPPHTQHEHGAKVSLVVSTGRTGRK